MVADNPQVVPLQVQYDTAGFGVLDLGATETVGSLEAIEKVLQRRLLRAQHPPGEHDEVRVMPEAKKILRFGHGQVKQSESYLLLPQHVGSKKVPLGISTLMTEKVPHPDRDENLDQAWSYRGRDRWLAGARQRRCQDQVPTAEESGWAFAGRFD